MAFMMHPLCQCFAPSIRSLLAGILPQQHAGRVHVENLKTREIVDDPSEELVRFPESTKTFMFSAGKLRRQEATNWRKCTGNGALSEVAQNMYISSITTGTGSENTTFRVRAGPCLK